MESFCLGIRNRGVEVKKICLPKEKVSELFLRLDTYADDMISEGKYVKKAIKELKRMLK